MQYIHNVYCVYAQCILCWLILNPSLLKDDTLKLQVYTKKLIFTYTTTRFMLFDWDKGTNITMLLLSLK
jgi:hypothetical protein